MPLIIAALLGGIASAMGSLVGRALVALGVGFVAYEGIDTLMTFIKVQALSQISSLPPALVGFIGVMKIGVVLSILLSALTTRMVVQGLSSGVLKGRVTK